MERQLVVGRSLPSSRHYVVNTISCTCQEEQFQSPRVLPKKIINSWHNGEFIPFCLFSPHYISQNELIYRIYKNSGLLLSPPGVSVNYFSVNSYLFRNMKDYITCWGDIGLYTVPPYLTFYYARCSAVSWGVMLQGRRSRVLIPIRH
jgi:glycosyltransferase involved in cell wall biosynthesis